MNIPDDALEAAARAIHEKGDSWDLDRTCWDDLTDMGRGACRQDARVALEAAAPLLEAQVLRETAHRFQRHADVSQDHGHQELCESFERAADILSEDADGLNPQ